MKTSDPTPPRVFEIILIKPSHYDDDGYVVQWLKSTMPSNSLAIVNALAFDAARKRVLGPNVEISVKSMDETNTRVATKSLVRRFEANGGYGFVGLVGVQSNEYPRALDIARPLRAAGIDVVIGGFHVSGCLSMLPEMPDDLREACDLGITLFAGESEDHMAELIRDAGSGNLRPIYNFMSGLPDIAKVSAPPFLDKEFVRRTVGNVTSFDAGRGCPYQCSFCTIINVQGRKSRFRSPDSVEQIIRSNWEQGVDRFFITDDNFARNSDWEAIYDRIIQLREKDGLDVRFMIQVDTLCHRIPNFIEKSKRAGVTRVFIGLENINPDNLLAAKKRQNKLTEYRKMLLAWKAQGIMTFAGYILGFPNDTPASVARDIEIVKEELPLDALEFFVLTPLPGSEDHQKMTRMGVAMDEDMNRYDLEHVVTAHPTMSREEWQQVYLNAWAQFYTDEHLLTILRRAHASGTDIRRLMVVLLWFSGAVRVEKLHPLQAGIFRRKHRLDRRPDRTVEPWLTFHLNYVTEVAGKHIALFKHWRKLDRMCRQVMREDPNGTYSDKALESAPSHGREDLLLYSQTQAAQAAVERERRSAGVA
jgi:tRNA A37 methylthiotransferase MiaB